MTQHDFPDDLNPQPYWFLFILLIVNLSSYILFVSGPSVFNKKHNYEQQQKHKYLMCAYALHCLLQIEVKLKKRDGLRWAALERDPTTSEIVQSMLEGRSQ